MNLIIIIAVLGLSVIAMLGLAIMIYKDFHPAYAKYDQEYNAIAFPFWLFVGISTGLNATDNFYIPISILVYTVFGVLISIYQGYRSSIFLGGIALLTSIKGALFKATENHDPCRQIWRAFLDQRDIVLSIMAGILFCEIIRIFVRRTVKTADKRWILPHHILYLAFAAPIFLISVLPFVSHWHCIEHRGVSSEFTSSSKLTHIAMYLDDYKMKHGEYPSGEIGLEGLERLKRRDNLNVDYWGNEIQYRYPAQVSQSKPYDLYSMGPDGVTGGGDDIYYE